MTSPVALVARTARSSSTEWVAPRAAIRRISTTLTIVLTVGALAAMSAGAGALCVALAFGAIGALLGLRLSDAWDDALSTSGDLDWADEYDWR